MVGEADRCIKCGSCMRACPVVSKVGEGVFPGPRSLAVDGPRGRRNAIRASDELLKCSMCHACASACPMKIEIPSAILRLRETGFDENALRPGHARMVHNIDQHRSSVEPVAYSSLPSDPASELCFFPGCIGRYRLPDIASAAIGILHGFGTSASCPNELVCCGSPLEKIGDKARQLRLQEQNLSILERYDRIVTSCPGCTGQLAEGYGLDAMHLVEHLFEDVGLSKISHAARHRDVKVAVHHPCHLNRLVGPHTKEYTIQLLQAIPGVKLVDYDAQEDCCGAGGSLLSGYPDIADVIGSDKASSAAAAGADMIVAACPFCVINLGRSGTMPTQDLGQFLFASLKR
ncbi:MAG: CoB--CoM heterodisulfide reductase iron-sulfur subunit D [Methanomassiliicoccales archaeon PtaU1.Bin124]|nr:MAG: CoB--CoM heterodisulfide reductase iron-sulfur subunit D [Methanomassiliicoccales archaeon PtaU1.Bin124]